MFLSEIYQIIDYKESFEEKKVNKIRIDSRKLSSEDVFICINGGYKYIKDAIEKSVALIITEQGVNYDTDIPIVKVKSTIKVLGLLAAYIRKKYNGCVIAITGSVGKTTTKELLSYILESKYKVLKTINSYNNHIGVPNTLLELDNSYDYVVLELGTNHPGEISYLSNIVDPDISIITNIGTSHIGNFENKEAILKEKLDIRKNSKLFINGEDLFLNNIDGIKVYKKDYDYMCDISHLTMNFYLVFKVCEYLGFNREELYSIVKNFKMSKSRMEINKINNIVLIDDTYNASLESVVAGLNSLNRYKSKLIILGDMLELGDMAYEIHKRLKKYIDSLSNVTLITLGKYTKVLKSNMHFNRLEDLNRYLYLLNYNNYDVIYVKGAHKMNLYETVLVLNKILQK